MGMCIGWASRKVRARVHRGVFSDSECVVIDSKYEVMVKRDRRAKPIFAHVIVEMTGHMHKDAIHQLLKLDVVVKRLLRFQVQVAKLCAMRISQLYTMWYQLARTGKTEMSGENCNDGSRLSDDEP